MRTNMAPHPNEERFYSETQLHEIADDIERAITITVNVMIEADHMWDNQQSSTFH
jgi:hypothetical protein